MTSKVQIAGAVASEHGITLYLANGTEMNLKVDEKLTEQILKQAIGPLSRGELVTLDLDTFSVERAIEKRTGGVLRFFKKLIGIDNEPVGGDDTILPAKVQAALAAPVKPQKVTSTVTEAEPVREELVAAVKMPDGSEKIIPGVEKLRAQINRAGNTGKVKGLQAFMQRIATVQHTHTVQELLNFMEKGDLPIADDGCIVAYKVLQSKGDHFVDCHTKSVTQKLGSLVSQDRKLIDPNRRNECSTGLHIARRKYLRSFSGDIITIVKIAPENVVAVPPNEPDKMRVSAYHIVGVLPSEVHDKLRSNVAMTDNSEAAKILADVIAGNHVGVLEYVTIGLANGGNVKVTPAKGATPAPEMGKNGEAKALDAVDGPDRVAPITPKQIRSQIQEEKTKPSSEAPVHISGPVAAAEADAQPAPKANGNRFVAKYPMIAGESKADRDARIKREKYALAKAAKAQTKTADAFFGKKKKAPTMAIKKPAVKSETKQQIEKRLKAEARKPLDPMRKIPGETKSARDARIKREKYALSKKK
jgi:hypothetical protein